jgi:subtilisin family serine protease
VAGLLVLLAGAPFGFTGAARQDQKFGSPQEAFAAKADRLLKIAYDRAVVNARRAGGGRRAADELDDLKKVAAIERKRDGVVKMDIVARLAARSDAELRAAGFAIGSRIGDVVTLEVEPERLTELAALASVREMAASTYMRPLNDRARQAAQLDNAAGTRQVSQTGRGVVVGIIDSGIDIRHPDFMVPGSNPPRTRIKALWDISDRRDDYTPPGATRSRGHLFTEADINAALAGSGTVEEKDLNGHGTHVAGTAAGNGNASGGLYAGIAPEADLVIVKATRSTTAEATLSTTDTINALSFIKQQAAALGNRPFVANISFGGQYGPHDGTAPHEVAIDSLVSEAAGRAVCVAAGNEGDEDIHASGFLRAGSEIELKIDARDILSSGSPTVSPEALDIYYNPNDRLSVTITKPNGATFGPFSYTPLAPGGNLPPPAYRDEHITIYNTLDDKGDQNPNNDQPNIFITFTDSAKDLGSNWTVRLRADQVGANGRFDAWLSRGRFDDDANPDTPGPAYLDGSRRISTPGNADGAITVGAFISYTRRADLQIGAAAWFTSQGPTADSRPKPEISAPGYYLYSTKSADSSFGTDPENRNNPSYTAASGTSMATPVVTGGVALMLQARPDLNNQQIKRFLTNYATNDSFTLPGWDARFGFGKINIAATMSAVLNGGNSIQDTAFFVRQHYKDFLSRDPDPPGFQGWLNILNSCAPGNAACDRVEVSSAFFRSPEFQERGYYIYRFYETSLGRQPRYVEFLPDMRRVSGFLTAEQLEARKNEFASEWLTRPEVRAIYDGLSNADFVDRLAQTAGVTLANRNQLVDDLNGGRPRAQVLRAVVESAEVNGRFFNRAFVVMQYFGYLRRDPDILYLNWINTLNSTGDYRTMINGFVNSAEYQLRFGYLPGF